MVKQILQFLWLDVIFIKKGKNNEQSATRIFIYQQNAYLHKHNVDHFLSIQNVFL